ncbi:gamma-glutamyltransferase family protein [Dactylosporangium sp. AC04546]|uniref:gamma-glutamyltransferase family protein n=1 Tax=Dactylosporangium sp. AC04546 TaxID=2862460 RepID=UPI001EDF04ED|nr:gamma-glutamyltransferase family protein [Dactylosporangium sp. AC04546]WVK84457.1 gamma-glutamyltransferase family protein [Dactylosporangium sp. AC04546]
MSKDAHPRQAVFAPRGVVATSQPLAASAGLAVLRRGGNAVDAAIATAVALTIVQPGSNDIGSDLFALVWDGSRLYGLNASGRSPALLTRDLVLEREPKAQATGALGGTQATAAQVMPARGWLPVTVPGAPAGWRDLHERFGNLPFADLFEDAIAYAEHGYPVSPLVAHHWGRAADVVHAALDGPEFAEWSRVFTPGGRAPRVGERFRNPDAARTLRSISGTTASSFYSGALAEALVTHAERTGGLLREADLTGHASTWVDPISMAYHGHEVWELPPNGQGIAALIALGLLDGLDETADLHQRIEAIKLGFADAHAHVADPAFHPVPELLDPRYLSIRRGMIGERAGEHPAGQPQRGGTVYLCTADADGRMVSLIQSNYMGFGSHVVVPGTGFSLQNRGAGFVLDEDHPNVVAPGKRPFHTIIPGFLTRGGAPVGPFGVMGGHMQPQGHLQVVLSTVDDRLDPQAALDRPRWYWHTGKQVQVEPGLAGEVEGLRRRGHEVTVVDAPGSFGYGQAIWRTDVGYVAGSEPRADGAALGY